MRQAGEPSVEEILASIKKVIARDNRVETTRRDHAPGHTPGADTALRDRFDVLDLDQIASQVLGNAPATADDAPENEAVETPLTSETTTSAMQSSLAALAMLSAPGARAEIVRSGETSLEGLVRDLLRPMLAEWLDQHLPAMVDRLVAAEITRIVRKKG